MEELGRCVLGRCLGFRVSCTQLEEVEKLGFFLLGRIVESKLIGSEALSSDPSGQWMRLEDTCGVRVLALSKDRLERFRVLRCCSNMILPSGLVNISAGWRDVLINLISISPSTTLSQMKWWWISMCLLLAWNTGFLANFMTDWMSQWIRSTSSKSVLI